VAENLYAQEPPPDNWDNTLYFSNKLAWGSDTWRQSTEFQTRFKDDFSALEQWHLEYAATYLASESWEFIPDFRFTRKPDRLEYRPGLGVIYKHIVNKSQLVHQIKYQYDAKGNGRNDSQGIRYAFFYNKVFSEHWIGTFLAGGLFEFGPDFSGFLGLRAGPAVAYVFNNVHSINVGYFYGLINDKQGNYSHLGIPSFQLIINIREKYKYVPAKYINF
jgi:hypothetical protein